MNKRKKSLAVGAASGCRTCEQAILNMHYHLQSLSPWAEVVYWPYLLGTGQAELEALKEIDVCFFTGAITTSAEHRLAEQLRKKTKVLVSCGACASFGGIPGLMNLQPAAGPEDPSKAEGKEIQGPFGLPEQEARVASLGQVVAVDYIIPGCPPTPSLLWAGFQALVSGPSAQSRLSFAVSRLPSRIAQAITAGIAPPKGTCFGGEKAVCASCSRVKEEKNFQAPIRPYEKFEESGRCLLEQGLVCLGMATREGCGGLCTGVGQPCRGCFGKAEAVYDPGGKMVSAIASTFAAEKNNDIEKLVADFQDLSGTFYRYTLADQCALTE